MSPVAAGVLFALLGLLVGAVTVALPLAAALIASGEPSLSAGAAGASLFAVAFACASTATIVAVAGGLQAPTAAAALALAVAWTAGGAPAWVAAPATLLTGLLIAHDTRVRRGPRIQGRTPILALAGTAAILAVAAAAGAETPAPPPAKTAAKPAPTTSAHGAAKPAPTTSAHGAAKPLAHAAPHAPVAIARAGAGEFVRAYYRALDGRRYAAAWRSLAPAVRTRFGGFANWRAGYATTLASRPVDVAVERAPDGSVTVRHVLVARDRTSCGGRVERRFRVTWRLVVSGRGWRAVALRATLPAGATSRASCR